MSVFIFTSKKAVKAPLFNILMSDYDSCEGFLRPYKKSEYVCVKIAEQMCVNCLVTFVKIGYALKASERSL